MFTVSTLGGCDGLEGTDFSQFLLWEECGGLERTDFEQFLLWEVCGLDRTVLWKVVVLKN